MTEENAGRNRITKLDSVRGIAALMVLVGHCHIPIPIDPRGVFFWLPIFWDGGSAVIMFFLLSGYVLALQLRSERRPSYAVFLVRRVLRIWPAFALATVLAFAALVLLRVSPGLDSVGGEPLPAPTLADLATNLLMVGSPIVINGPAWSLFVEMRLSVIFPLLFELTRKRGFLAATMLSMAISILGSRLVHWEINGFLVSLAEASRYLFLFVIGACLADPENWVAAIYRRITPSAKYVGVFLAICFAVYRFIPIDLPAKNYVPWISVGLIFIFILNSNAADRMLNMPVLLFLGRISYGIYLVHYPILQIANAFLPATFGLLVVLPCSILLGWMINIIIENPSVSLGRKLDRKKGSENISV